jgi:hypothetical protein
MNIQRGRCNLINLSATSDRMIVEYFHPAHFKFRLADTEENFQKNLKTQPSDWYYRNHQVKYTMNGQFYRCEPFDKINWNESIVIFGCSNVFGDAVDDSDTIAANLKQLIGCNVINLGLSGSCQQDSLYNMMTLKNNNIKPRAIIHVWTDSMRLFCIDNDFQKCFSAQWNNFGFDPDVKPGIFEHTKSHIVSAMFNRMIANNVYHDIPVIHATHFEEMQYEQSKLYPNMPLTLLSKSLDNARDLQHFGRESHNFSAKLLQAELLKFGIK